MVLTCANPYNLHNPKNVNLCLEILDAEAVCSKREAYKIGPFRQHCKFAVPIDYIHATVRSTIRYNYCEIKIKLFFMFTFLIQNSDINSCWKVF